MMVQLRFISVTDPEPVTIGTDSRHTVPAREDYVKVPGRQETWLVVRRRQNDTTNPARGDQWDIAVTLAGDVPW